MFLLDKNRDYAQVLEERNGADSLLVRYQYGDDLISQKRDSLTYFYHTDGQLSTRQLTDVSQNITDTYTYDAFGLLLNQTGGTENNYLYTGEQYDPNVGFYYLRARYYNASIGRFQTMDTWPGSMFEPASLHKYLYCEGNPVNMWDPSGELTLLQVTLTIAITSILLNLAISVCMSALNLWTETTDWNGTVAVASYGRNIKWNFAGVAFAAAYFSSDDGARGMYYLLLAGLSFSFLFDVGSSMFNVTLETPKVFGDKPQYLAGNVSWFAGSAVAGLGYSLGIIQMGFGRAKKGKEISKSKGVWDVGVDIMGGIAWNTVKY